MTQRIFDVDNPQDVRELFDILPDKVKTVVQDSIDSEELELYDKDRKFIDSCAHIRVNWRDKEEIDRPIDESEWIGCLCWFCDDALQVKRLGILKKIDKDYDRAYEESNGSCYPNCRPARRDEIKFVEDVE